MNMIIRMTLNEAPKENFCAFRDLGNDAFFCPRWVKKKAKRITPQNKSPPGVF